METVEDQLDAVVATGVPGAVAVALGPGERVEAAAGFADLRTGESLTVDHRFRIGSVTKIFVAALVVQLVAEGLLDLDGDAAPFAEGVTIRQLLNHTRARQSSLRSAQIAVGSPGDRRRRLPSAPPVHWSAMAQTRTPNLGPASRPIAVPADLSDRSLPKASGRVELPLHIRWSEPPVTYDLGDRADRARVFEQVLREGTDDDVRFYVDADQLLELWDELVLPPAVRLAWSGWIERRYRDV